MNCLVAASSRVAARFRDLRLMSDSTPTPETLETTPSTPNQDSLTPAPGSDSSAAAAAAPFDSLDEAGVANPIRLTPAGNAAAAPSPCDADSAAPSVDVRTELDSAIPARGSFSREASRHVEGKQFSLKSPRGAGVTNKSMASIVGPSSAGGSKPKSPRGSKPKSPRDSVYKTLGGGDGRPLVRKVSRKSLSVVTGSGGVSLALVSSASAVTSRMPGTPSQHCRTATEALSGTEQKKLKRTLSAFVGKDGLEGHANNPLDLSNGRRRSAASGAEVDGCTAILKQLAFPIVCFLAEMFFIVLYATCTKYGASAVAPSKIMDISANGTGDIMMSELDHFCAYQRLSHTLSGSTAWLSFSGSF